MRPRPSDRWSRHRSKNQRRWFLLSLLLSSLFLFSFFGIDLTAATLRRANSLGRRCSPAAGLHLLSCNLRIAIVSLSEEREGLKQKRSFRGVKEIVWGNKKAYAKRIGYDFVDASALIDRSRPSSWSKILAVRSVLPHYDWVFWNDADTLVTNPDISLENILFGLIGHSDFHSAPDLVVTEDFNGVNAGVFFVRRSQWSTNFLDTWWNQTSFIQFGSTKSGDNTALKQLIKNLPPEELHSHVLVSPMQCVFNSYPWSPSWKSISHLVFSPWTTWKGVYSDGDFMVHLAGIDDKTKWASKIILEMRTPQRSQIFN